MEQIIYELNGKRYLLVEVFMTSATQDKIKDAFYKYGCIHQGIKEVKKDGILSSGYAIVRVLVPEEYIEAFNREEV